jgi:hypothetical protein
MWKHRNRKIIHTPFVLRYKPYSYLKKIAEYIVYCGAPFVVIPLEPGVIFPHLRSLIFVPKTIWLISRNGGSNLFLQRPRISLMRKEASFALSEGVSG